jgi:hypothetical protein
VTKHQPHVDFLQVETAGERSQERHKVNAAKYVEAHILRTEHRVKAAVQGESNHIVQAAESRSERSGAKRRYIVVTDVERYETAHFADASGNCIQTLSTRPGTLQTQKRQACVYNAGRDTLAQSLYTRIAQSYIRSMLDRSTVRWRRKAQMAQSW